VKGEGGRVRWEERKGAGVGERDSVERMLSLSFADSDEVVRV